VIDNNCFITKNSYTYYYFAPLANYFEKSCCKFSAWTKFCIDSKKWQYLDALIMLSIQYNLFYIGTAYFWWFVITSLLHKNSLHLYCSLNRGMNSLKINRLNSINGKLSLEKCLVRLLCTTLSISIQGRLRVCMVRGKSEWSERSAHNNQCRGARRCCYSPSQCRVSEAM